MLGPRSLRQNSEKGHLLAGKYYCRVMIGFLCNQDYYQVNTKGYLRKLFFSDDSREYLDNALHFYNEIHYEVSLCCI